MSSQKYTFVIATAFPNSKIDSDRLQLEINSSLITIALENVQTHDGYCDVTFKTSLSNNEENILNTIISTHSGEVFYVGPPLSSTGAPIVQLVNRQGDDVPVFANAPRIGDEVIYTTHNFCDKCTWFGDSVRVTDEILTDSGDHKRYNCLNINIIDMISGRVQDDDGHVAEQQQLNPEDPHGYQVIVKVDDIEKVMREPLEESGGDYEVFWEDGYIQFFSEVSSNSVVKCSYSYATTSNFYLRPLPGKNLHIEAAETDFSYDIIMTDGIEYNVYGYVDVFAPQYMYKRLTGTAQFTNGSTTVIGINTLFTTEVSIGKYIRIETDGPESYMLVSNIISDTEITLVSQYTGSSTTLTVACSNNFTGVYPSLTKIPLSRTRYKKFYNIVQEAIGSYPSLPAIGCTTEQSNITSLNEFRRKARGTKSAMQSIPFRYGTIRELVSDSGLELRVTTSHHRMFGGESATLTFYCTSHDSSHKF